MDAVWAYGHALCCNALAARYALWAACVLAPLYAFVLRPAACARMHADDDEAAIAAATTSDVATRRAPPLATRDASHSATMTTTTTTVTTATHHESLMLESRVQHALARCYSLRACDACNVTPRALEELYASPAFARWYAARRAGLLAQVAQRRRYRRWTSVAALALLLVGVCALPAYSFDDVPRLDLVPRASYDTHTDNNNNDNSSSSRSPPSLSSRAVRASTLAQLLVQRAADVRVRADKAASSSSSSSSLLLVLRSLVPHVRAEAEVMLIVTTLCTLLTTPFMPPRSTHAATVALLCLCVVLAESVAVATAQLRLGFGFLVVFGVVAWRVVRLPST